MTEIKAGDRVRIAETVDRERYDKTCGWCSSMELLFGTEGVVTRVFAGRGWAEVCDPATPGAWFWHLDDLTAIPKGHPHAALMLEYAKDAQTHERPWELWEVRSGSRAPWASPVCNLTWRRDFEYRRKPIKKMVLVNGVEVPAPETEAPDVDTGYWIADPASDDIGSLLIVWRGDDADRLWLARGLVYLNREDAIARAEAMLITKEADHGSF